MTGIQQHSFPDDKVTNVTIWCCLVFFLTSSGFLRELMARIVRNAIGRVVCVIADYSAAVLAEARRLRAMVIADRPTADVERELRSARQAGELAGLVVVDAAGDGVPPYPGAPAVARKLILANGDHSPKEAIAHDLHVLGHDVRQIAEWLGVDGETAKTFVRRAERKNRRHPELLAALARLGNGDT